MTAYYPIVEVQPEWVSQPEQMGGKAKFWYLAPSFDHASALGRELEDKRRDGLIVNNRIANYSDNGKGGIYWCEADANGPSPLELIRLAARQYPVILRSGFS